MAEVPLWVAVRVALPPPKMPQLAVMVADVGLTAAAVGANARPVTARAPAASAAPVAIRLFFMGVGAPFPCGDCHVGGGGSGVPAGRPRQVGAVTLRAGAGF